MISLHIDVDNLWMYEQEYNIRILDDSEYIYKKALPKLIEILEKSNSKATFMIIGKDLQRETCRKFCNRAVSLGHEIANHSFSHPTLFTKLSLKQKRDEIQKTHELITKVCKIEPVGFRSPGYTFDPEIIPLLQKLGYHYDSSILPGIAQFLMSAYARLAKGEIKNKSFGSIKDIYSKTKPYLLTNRKKTKNIYELPISVLPGFRLPVHTTFAYYFGEKYRQLILHYLSSKPTYVTYLMHAIDFVDLPPAAPKQAVIPLRYPYKQREVFLKKVIKAMVIANGGPLKTTREQINSFPH